MRAGWVACIALLLGGCSVADSISENDISENDDASPIATSADAENAISEGSLEVRRLSDRINRLGASFSGTIAIAVRPVDSGLPIAYNGDRPMPQQSVSKLWVALAAFGQAADGSLAWNERVRIGSQDLTLFYQPIEKIVRRDGAFDTTFGDLVRRAIIGSDNTANDRLLRRVGGPEAVRANLRKLEIADIRFGPGERAMQSAIAGMTWDQSYSRGRVFFERRDRVPAIVRQTALDDYVSDPVDGATANAITLALSRLARGELLPPRQTKEFLEILAQTKSGPNRLKGGLPEGWAIAHKTGTGQVFGKTHTGYNDVAILTAPDGTRYAVAVMIAETQIVIPDRMALMHEVVQAVEDYHAS